MERGGAKANCEEYNQFVPWEKEVLRPILVYEKIILVVYVGLILVYGVLSQPYTTNHTVYIVFKGAHQRRWDMTSRTS